MIEIALLLLLFLLYVSIEREGLRNYMPIEANNKVYGVNVIKNNPDHIYNKLRDPTNPLYDQKFNNYAKSDIILDMQYFNNASYLMFQLS
jgi:hypothetical protein